MRKIILIAALALALAGCQSRSTTYSRGTHALEIAGYTNVKAEVNGPFDLFTGCGEKDSYSISFTATGPNGHPAQGEVCMGYTKGSTIRLD